MTTTTSPFPGVTRPGIGVYDLTFDTSGALWMLGEEGLAVHRRGHAKPERITGREGIAPALGGSGGLAVSAGLVLVSPRTGPVLLDDRGTALVRFEVAEPVLVAISPDGSRVAVGTGRPGGVGSHVAVFDRAGALVLRVDDEAIRNDTGAFCFVDEGRSLAFVANGVLVRVDTESGVVRRAASFREGFTAGPTRVEPLADAVLASFAGRGRQCAIGAAVLDHDGRARWVAEAADGVASNARADLIAIVRGDDIEVRRASGEKLPSARRAKASFTIDAAAISDDGWLALASGARSGARAKAVELIHIGTRR